MDSDLFYAGTRPAIDAGTSVSRVGGDAQIKAMKKVSGTLRLDLASYTELASFAQFGSDLDEATQSKLNRGARTVEVLKQGLHQPETVEQQVVTLFALSKGFIDAIEIEDIQRYESELFSYMTGNHQEILDEITSTSKLPEGDGFYNAIKEFSDQFQGSKQVAK